MRRGGSEAAYTTISRGGAWAVYPKGALATACTAPTDSRPPAQSLLQPATSSENLDRDSTHSTELQGFVQKAIEMHQGKTLTPPKKRSQCGALVEPSSGIKKTPTCSYRKFQQQHRGLWQGRQRCPWPHGKPRCNVCVNLGLFPPEDIGLSPVEKQAPSATAVAPVEPVPDLSTSNRHSRCRT